MQVKEEEVQRLTQDPENSRSHDRKNLDAIKQSLEAFGQQKPIVIDHQGKVIAGNGTLAAAQELGWKTIQAVVSNLEGASQTAYAIADNRTAELAAWNDEQLAKSLVSLQNDDSIDEAISGFDTKEIDKMVQSIAAQNEVVEDEIPENVEPVTKPGDLWKLGRHRLLCGDSTKAENVERLMDGEAANIVLTDPPYGMHLDTDYTKMGDTSQNHKPVIGDDCEFAFFDIGCNEQFWFGGDYYSQTLPKGGSWSVWDKYPTDTNDKRFGSGFEMIWSKQKHKRKIYRIPSLNVGHHKREAIVHPTQKPSDLLMAILVEYSEQEAVVWDGFIGSGSTLIACTKTQRRCYGMEIDPAYCDVIIKRWENLTGETAERLEG